MRNALIIRYMYSLRKPGFPPRPVLPGHGKMAMFRGLQGKGRMQKHILYGLVATCMWGVWAILVKLASGRIGHWPSVMVYTLASVTTTVVIFTSLGKSLRGMDPAGVWIAVAAGVLGGLAVVFFQKALSVGPVSTTTAISALYPVFAVVFGVLFLKERLSPLNYAGIAMALAAGVLISL